MNDDRAGAGPLRFLILGASTRRESLNKRLARLAVEVVERNGGIVDYITMADIDMPLYNADVQDSAGFPPGADRLRGLLAAADGFVISSPEYNFTMPGALNNAIDWVSRYRPHPLKGKHGLLMSASPSMAGGNRGLWALRVPLEHLGAHVYPDMFSLAQAHTAFDEGGRISNGQLQEWFEGNVSAFMDLVEAAKHYPCAKRHWIEFLGEQPSPLTARA